MRLFFALHFLILCACEEEFPSFTPRSLLQIDARLGSEDAQSMLQAGDSQLTSNQNIGQDSHQTGNTSGNVPTATGSQAPAESSTSTSTILTSASSTVTSLNDRLAALDAAHPDAAESRIASDIVASINAAEQEGAKKVTDQLEPRLIERENRVKELEAQLRAASGKSGSEVRLKGYWTQDGLHLILFASLVASYVV